MYKFTNRIVPFDSLFPVGDVIPEDNDKLKLILEDDSKRPENSYDEIIPNLFIGDEFVATNLKILKSLSITHIVNAAQGTSRFHYVDTDPSYYGWKGFQCKYLGLPASDVPDFEISQFFGMATSFMEDALAYTRNGRVLVHSLEGTSRSATLVVAYFMLFRKLTAVDAMKLVRSKRNIHPNDGFLKQLCDLEFVLKLRAQNESESESEDSEGGEKGTGEKSRRSRHSRGQTGVLSIGPDGDYQIETSTYRDEITQNGEKTGKISERNPEKGGRADVAAEDSDAEEEDNSGNVEKPSKDGKPGKPGKPGASPAGKRVTFADKPHHHHSPKSPSCKVHPGGKGTPPVTPENRCAIHGCKNRAQDKKKKSEGKKSPHRHSPTCKVHGMSPKRVCAIHGDVTQKDEDKKNADTEAK